MATSRHGIKIFNTVSKTQNSSYNLVSFGKRQPGLTRYTKLKNHGETGRHFDTENSRPTCTDNKPTYIRNTKGELDSHVSKVAPNTPDHFYPCRSGTSIHNFQSKARGKNRCFIELQTDALTGKSLLWKKSKLNEIRSKSAESTSNHKCPTRSSSIHTLGKQYYVSTCNIKQLMPSRDEEDIDPDELTEEYYGNYYRRSRSPDPSKKLVEIYHTRHGNESFQDLSENTNSLPLLKEEKLSTSEDKSSFRPCSHCIAYGSDADVNDSSVYRSRKSEFQVVPKHLSSPNILCKTIGTMRLLCGYSKVNYSTMHHPMNNEYRLANGKNVPYGVNDYRTVDVLSPTGKLVSASSSRLPVPSGETISPPLSEEIKPAILNTVRYKDASSGAATRGMRLRRTITTSAASAGHFEDTLRCARDIVFQMSTLQRQSKAGSSKHPYFESDAGERPQTDVTSSKSNKWFNSKKVHINALSKDHTGSFSEKTTDSNRLKNVPSQSVTAVRSDPSGAGNTATYYRPNFTTRKHVHDKTNENYQENSIRPTNIEMFVKDKHTREYVHNKTNENDEDNSNQLTNVETFVKDKQTNKSEKNSLNVDQKYTSNEFQKGVFNKYLHADITSTVDQGFDPDSVTSLWERNAERRTEHYDRPDFKLKTEKHDDLFFLGRLEDKDRVRPCSVTYEGLQNKGDDVTQHEDDFERKKKRADIVRPVDLSFSSDALKNPWKPATTHTGGFSNRPDFSLRTGREHDGFFFRGRYENKAVQPNITYKCLQKKSDAQDDNFKRKKVKKKFPYKTNDLNVRRPQPINVQLPRYGEGRPSYMKYLTGRSSRYGNLSGAENISGRLSNPSFDSAGSEQTPRPHATPGAWKSTPNDGIINHFVRRNDNIEKDDFYIDFHVPPLTLRHRNALESTRKGEANEIKRKKPNNYRDMYKPKSRMQLQELRKIDLGDDNISKWNRELLAISKKRNRLVRSKYSPGQEELQNQTVHRSLQMKRSKIFDRILRSCRAYKEG